MARCAGLRAFAGFSAALLAIGGCGPGAPATPRDVRVRVDRIVIDENDAPVVVLEEEGGTRWLPIWIGRDEARSIALEIEQVHPPRPNSHDLARDLIRGLDAEVARVVVTELREGTYYALMHVRRGDRTVPIDARPSDAIAIALRAGAPIFVREPLFDQSHADESTGGDSPRREI
jgi:hypothetical protein